MIHENYGDVTVNIDPGSIYTGALGAPFCKPGNGGTIMTLTAGIDIGTNSVKSVLFRIEEGSSNGLPSIQAGFANAIKPVGSRRLSLVIEKTDTDPDEVAYVATQARERMLNSGPDIFIR